MTTAGNVAGLDAQGQEVLWSSRGQQVMMQWERQYMHRAVDALCIRPSDRVLEIGFGLGYSASRVQSFSPKRHTIVECDVETLRRAEAFAAAHPGVQIVAGTWQQTLHSLGDFDCVFFDDFPLPELLPSSDATAIQGAEFTARRRSRWHEFLDVALRHCAAGARISGYLARELDLQRPGCRVEVSAMQVDVPEHCNYFPHKTALVPVITVVDPIAAGEGSADVGAGAKATLLPHASKKFLRAFENASRRERAQSGFARERGQMEEIREFLLAHEMDALSYDYFGGNESDEDVAMDSENCFVGKVSDRDDQELIESQHYCDKQSRQEFMHRLRSKAAATKRATR